MGYNDQQFKAKSKEYGKGTFTIGNEGITFSGNNILKIAYSDIREIKKQSYFSRLFWYVISFTFSSASRNMTIKTANGKQYVFTFKSLRKLKKATKSVRSHAKHA